MTSLKNLLHGAAKCKHFAIITRVNFSHSRELIGGCENNYGGRLIIRRLQIKDLNKKMIRIFGLPQLLIALTFL